MTRPIIFGVLLLGLAACETPLTAVPSSRPGAEEVTARQVISTDSVVLPGVGVWQATVVRERGMPRTIAYPIMVPPGTYRLELRHEDDSHATGTVELNGAPIVRPSDFGKSRGMPLIRMVTVGVSNLLTVRLTGAPGSAVTLRLIEPRVGTTDTVRWLTNCARQDTLAYLCFDATLATTWQVGQRTSITLQLRNLQGALPLPLPPSAIQLVSILARSGAGPSAIAPPTFNASGVTNSVGITVPRVGTTSLAFPPYPGGPQFFGLVLDGFALTGCIVPPYMVAPSFWQTCGSGARGVVLRVEVAGRWQASDLFLYVAGPSRPIGLPQPSCATGPVPLGACQPAF